MNPMHASKLMLLLAESGFTPLTTRQAANVADDWFVAEPNSRTFAVRAILRELAGEWDDEQGIETALHAPFAEVLLPELRRQLAAPSVELDQLVRAFHSCLVAVRKNAKAKDA